MTRSYSRRVLYIEPIRTCVRVVGAGLWTTARLA
jgi:hypothetical protein